jgi:hypothetical protein
MSTQGNILGFSTSTVIFRLQTKRPWILCPPSPGLDYNRAVTKQPPFFTWIMTKIPLCDIFPTCFTTSLFPYCDKLSPSDIYPSLTPIPLPILWHLILLCHFHPARSGYPLPFLPFIVYLHSKYALCVYRNYMLQSSQWRGWGGVMVRQTEEKSINPWISVPCAVSHTQQKSIIPWISVLSALN